MPTYIATTISRLRKSIVNWIKSRRISLLWGSILFAAFYAIQILLMFFDLRPSSNLLRNFIALGYFLLPFLPLLWFHQIKLPWLKKWTVNLYSVVLLPILCIAQLGIAFALFIVIGGIFNGNGERPVFEKHLQNATWLVIYRTGDQGVLGGDHIQPAIVDKVFPGLERVHRLNEADIVYDHKSDSNFIVIDGHTHRVPKDRELRKLGNLYGTK